jgi:hypothetical protein
MDLFNNPMVEAARKAMTPEQKEEYKKIGEYMYNNEVYKVIEVGSKIKEADNSQLILYATEALKSGGNPHDLSAAELTALINVYGDRWYEKFGFEENEVPKPIVQLVTGQEAKSDIIKEEKKVNPKKRKVHKYK